MKGVYADSTHGGWVASYGKEYRKRFPTKEQAKKQRQNWEALFGELNGGHPKDWSGKESGNLKVVGSTGKNKKHSQILLVKNKITGKYSEVTAKDFSRGGVKGTFGYDRKQTNNTTGYSGVQQTKKGIYKEKYLGVVTINKHTYVTSHYDSPKEAYKAKQKILMDYLQKGVLPDLTKTKAKSGHKYITYDSRKNRAKKYAVRIQNKIGKCRTTFNTLPEALIYRNQWLTEHNLPIPD